MDQSDSPAQDLHALPPQDLVRVLKVSGQALQLPQAIPKSQASSCNPQVRSGAARGQRSGATRCSENRRLGAVSPSPVPKASGQVAQKVSLRRSGRLQVRCSVAFRCQKSHERDVAGQVFQVPVVPCQAEVPGQAQALQSQTFQVPDQALQHSPRCNKGLRRHCKELQARPSQAPKQPVCPSRRPRQSRLRFSEDWIGRPVRLCTRWTQQTQCIPSQWTP